MKTIYRLYHEDNLKYENDDLNLVYFRLQRLQSQSSFWAIKYEGWRIMEVNEFGQETEIE